MRPPLGRAIAATLLAVALYVPAAWAQQQGDAATVKKALAFLKDGNSNQAFTLAGSMNDPAARDLVTWLAIRLTAKDVGFDRARDFIAKNPNWPSIALIRRRAEGLLLSEKREPKEVRAFFGSSQPVSGEGMVALARALIA